MRGILEKPVITHTPEGIIVFPAGSQVDITSNDGWYQDVQDADIKEAVDLLEETDELTRLRAIRDAVAEFDDHQTQAGFNWDDSRVCPDYEDDALDEDAQAEEALELALQLTRKELK